MAQEKNYENKIKRYVESLGGWQVKFFANRMTKTGVPDILVCLNGQFIGIEVKADKGVPSDLQLYQIGKIRNAGGLAFVVYPSGWEQLCEILDNCSNGLKNDNLPIIIK